MFLAFGASIQHFPHLSHCKTIGVLLKKLQRFLRDMT